MDANVSSVLNIFEKKLHLEVPLFQRQYVWSEEKHWAPLWEDISRKFAEYLDGRKDAPAHFLGALVLDQKQVPTTHVERRLIIDGQQRLTTFQILISALRDFCAENDCPELAKECNSFIINTGMMANPEVEQFKVSPTQRDQQQFCDVTTSRSRAELEKRHPLKRKKYARKFEPRPRMVEAYLYFYDQFREFFRGTETEPPLQAELPLADRLDECIQALKRALNIVIIDLGKDDDAQVIFETLNARGEPLLPADLLRNYIFLRASRNNEPREALYEKYWSRFDDNFWRVEVSQGRLNRPRSDLFLQHYLASQVMREIPIKHLFVEYKYWIEKNKPFTSVNDELTQLAKQGDAFRRIMAPSPDDVLYSLGSFLNAFEIGTAHPLLLALLEADIDDAEWRTIAATIESYILRRAICGLTTKNYNRVFLSATKQLRDNATSAEALEVVLSANSGDSTEWPNDRVFGQAWKERNIYSGLPGPRCVHVLKRLNETFYNSKHETVTLTGPLTVEHLLPQDWIEHWPLPDGRRGLSSLDRLISDDAELAAASDQRDSLLQTVGNLTLMTQPLNSSVSNLPWLDKRKEIIAASLLPISVELRTVEAWNEQTILHRSEQLFDRALKIWPGPKRT